MSSKADAIQRLIDQNKPLMDLCSKVGHDIFVAERAKAMWMWVADHAETINGANFGLFFGTLQHMALTEMFVALGRVFDEERHHAKVCIKQILVLMRTSNMVDRSHLLQFLQLGAHQHDAWIGLSDSAARDKAIEIILRRRPTFSSSDELGRVLEMRHTEIAHRTLDPRFDRGRPKFEDVDHCINWGKEFIGMVGKVFGNHVFKYDDGSYWSDYDVKSSIMSIRRLTHKAGIVIDPGFAETERLMATSSKA
jgi:AbiU2